MKNKNSLTSKLVDGVKKVGKHIVDNAKIYTAAGLTTLGTIGYSQSNSMKAPEGFNYGSAMVEGKKYEISADTIHGTGYLVREADVSRKNETGLEFYPSQFWSFDYTSGDEIFGSHSDVTYVPQRTGLTEIVLATEEDSSIFSLPSATFGQSNGQGDVTGRSYKFVRDVPNINFKTYTAPTGQTFYVVHIPESDAKVASGEATNKLLLDTATTKLLWNYEGKPVMKNAEGKIYIPLLTDDSDKSKVFSIESKYIPYLATEFVSQDSLDNLTDYFTGKDSTGFNYVVPNSEMSKIAKIDLNNIEIINDSVPKTEKIDAGQNLVLNSDYPEKYEVRIKSADEQTGEAILTGEPTNTKRTKSRKGVHLSDFFNYVHPGVGVEGTVKGFNHQDFSFGGNGTFSLLFGKDLTIGSFLDYSFEKGIWKNGPLTISSGKLEEFLDLDKDINGNDIFRYSVLDSSVNSQISYLNSPLVIGGKINTPLFGLDNLYLNLGLGVGSRDVTETTTGNSTAAIQKRNSDGKVLEERTLEIGNAPEDKFEKDLGKERALVFESGLEFFPGKENQSLSIGVDYKYITGIEGKSQNGDHSINLKADWYPFRR